MGLRKHRWERAGSIYGAYIKLPARPGVYAIGIVDEVSGLPTGTNWVYIGKSSNLRMRVAQHSPEVERNFDLAKWLRLNNQKAEVWYVQMGSAEATELEKILIRIIKPITNKIQFKEDF